MRDDRDARGEQLGPRRVDEQVAGAVGRWKRNAWYAPGISRSSSSACATAVRKSTSQSVGASAWYASPRARLRRNARWLVRRADGADRRVGERPVDRQAEPAPQLLERLLVLARRAARTARGSSAARSAIASLPRLRGRLERRVVRQVRIAAHAVEVLHAPLGRQPVVVPAHRVEDLAAAHALVARERVGLHVAERRAHVQRAAHRRRRRVDREDFGACAGAVEAVRTVRLPLPRPSARRGRRASACRARGRPGRSRFDPLEERVLPRRRSSSAASLGATVHRPARRGRYVGWLVRVGERVAHFVACRAISARAQGWQCRAGDDSLPGGSGAR